MGVNMIATSEARGALRNVDILSRIALIPSKGRIACAKTLTRVPKVSVVIPCYNYGRYLRQCVDSVLTGQPGIELEVIIVDDKSTDDSLRIAREIEAEDARVRVIAHEVNKGHITTYNDGLDAVSGEFALLISADDLATPGALTRAAELMVANPSVGLVYGTAIHFHDARPPARTDGKAWIIWHGIDWLRVRCRSGYNVVASPEVIMRTSLLKEFGGYRQDLPHAGDFEMWLRASAVSGVGFLVGVDQAYYRHHTANMNSTMFSSGTPKGQLIDVKQRWHSFEAIFAGVGCQVDGAVNLLRTARKTLAKQALEQANYAFARGFKDFPVDEFEAFAKSIQPSVESTRTGRALARRRRLGMVPLPLHPLWAASAIAWRLKEHVRRWRRAKIGI